MLSGIFSKKEKKEIEWTPLTSLEDLDELNKDSYEQPALIFKHSTRCSISSMMLNKFEKAYKEKASFKIFYLDLIENRAVSNQIVTKYGIAHQSPQTILIYEGNAVCEASHTAINYQEIEDKAKEFA